MEIIKLIREEDREHIEILLFSDEKEVENLTLIKKEVGWSDNYYIAESTKPDFKRISINAPGNNIYLFKLTYEINKKREIPYTFDKLPKIIDFEPKTRDLYQTATDSSEILSASKSDIITGKSNTHTVSTETGITTSVKGGLSIGPFDGGVENSTTHKWGETNQDSYTEQSDSSHERRETQGTVTNINQMYNLLSGYHTGTNRASFLMLPRPHTLQPTPYRTFVHGLRVIEGIQDFFLIVIRPKDSTGLSIEVNLETGHFPEDTPLLQPDTKYEEKVISFEHYRSSVANKGCEDFVVVPPVRLCVLDFSGEFSFSSEISQGWEFDPTKGFSGSGGILQDTPYSDDNLSASNPNWGNVSSITPYSYKIIEDKVIIEGKAQSIALSSIIL